MRRLTGVLPFGLSLSNTGAGRRCRPLLMLLVSAAWFWPVSGAAAAAPLTPQTGIAAEGQVGGRATSIAALGATVFLATGPFGYPTSRVFTFEGFPVQFFQR